MRSLALATAAICASLTFGADAALALSAQPVSTLNVRVGPSTSTSILYTLQAGTVIDVISCGSGWCKLNTGGYVSEAYLRPAGAAPAPSSPAPHVAVPQPQYPQPQQPQYPQYPQGGYGNGGSYGGGNYGGQYGGFDPQYVPYEDDDFTPAFPQNAPGGYGTPGNGGWPNYAPYDQPGGPGGFQPFPNNPPQHYAGAGPDSFPFAFGIEANNPKACFYNQPRYNAGGFCRQSLGDEQQIRGIWNDKISSIWVDPRYAVIACTGAGFSGQCHIYTGNVSWVGREMDNRISSFRVVRR